MNYCYFFLNNISIKLNIETLKGLSNKNNIKSDILINEFQIYNQLDQIGKFPLIFNNSYSPFITIRNEIEYFKELNIANIKTQNINVSQIQLSIDPQFIRKIFDFFDNILYRMNITNFNVHKIFLNKEENIQKKLIKKYNKGNLSLISKDILYPKLNIEFELSKIGLKEFLRERMGCSDFYIWIAKGLVNNKNNLELELPYLSFKNEGIIQYLEWVYYQYKNILEDKITDIGFQGIFGKVKNFFDKLDIFDEDDKEINYFQKKRKRMPRVFYGKFKYFKEYNKDDEISIANIYSKNSFLNNSYYPTNIIKCKSSFFLFTSLSMFFINSRNYEILWNIDYYSVKKAEANNLIVKVDYNQIIDSKTFCTFECENKDIAKEVAKSLNEESINNRENILDI